MRISIIGHSGSGKSWLGKRIGERLGIPHLDLDRFWFEAGGAKTSKATPIEEKERIRAYIREKVQEATEMPAWVSDGLYSRVQDEIASKADVVLFLDIPLWQRLLNHAKRMMRPSTRHKELSVWMDLMFFCEMVRRTYAFRPKLQKVLEAHQDKIVTLRSHKEARAYLNSL